jgi:pyruvate ferredoxin oxidoreductase beta subunit
MYRPDTVVELSKSMVQSGMAVLWSYKEGVFQRTVKPGGDQKKSLETFLSLQGRYAGLSPEDIKALEDHIEKKARVIESMEKGFGG